MPILAQTVESTLNGTIALYKGTKQSILSPKIRSTFFRFLAQFIVISLLGYSIVSATLISIPLLIMMVFLGPVLGSLFFMAFCYVSCFVLGLLWLMDKFPVLLFTGRFGVLQPFVSVQYMSFLLSSLLLPANDFFVLDGIDACYNKNQQRNNNNDNTSDDAAATTKQIRDEYVKPSVFQTVWLACCNATFGIVLKLVFMLIPLGGGGNRSVVNFMLSAFLLGSQLVSTYTVRIRRMSFTKHLNWCCGNALRILGFMVPFQLIQGWGGWMATVLSLGLGYSATATLVEELVVSVHH